MEPILLRAARMQLIKDMFLQPILLQVARIQFMEPILLQAVQIQLIQDMFLQPILLQSARIQLIQDISPIVGPLKNLRMKHTDSQSKNMNFSSDNSRRFKYLILPSKKPGGRLA
jgi:hypothetical protein